MSATAVETDQTETEKPHLLRWAVLIGGGVLAYHAFATCRAQASLPEFAQERFACLAAGHGRILCHYAFCLEYQAPVRDHFGQHSDIRHSPSPLPFDR